MVIPSDHFAPVPGYQLPNVIASSSWPIALGLVLFLNEYWVLEQTGKGVSRICKKLYILLEIYWLEDINKHQKCIDFDFCIDAAIAVDFDIDEIEVLDLLFADDIYVNAAKGAFLY